MLKQKRRFLILSMIMVALVGLTSMLSTWLLFRTSLEEQKRRLHELVQSQASLAIELGRLGVQLELVNSGDNTRDIVLEHLVRAHRKFQIESQSGEFTVGRRSGDNIEFLVVNGERVPSFSQLASIPLDSPFAAPMEKAIYGESGTMIGLDYEGNDVLAAYTPLILQYDVLGMVAKIDIDEIKAPFFRANFIIFGVGILLISIGLLFFFRLSEPIIRELQSSEKNYRDLVEGANSLILRIDNEGFVSFANSYAQDYLTIPEMDLVGINAVDLLFDDALPDLPSYNAESLLQLFGEGSGPYELPLPPVDGRIEWISWNIQRITDDEGKLEELLCIGENITAGRLAREAQREVEDRFRGIAKASPVGIVISDMEGNLLYANERMHSLTGLNTAEMSGQGWLSQIPADDRQTIIYNWFKTSSTAFARLEFRVAKQSSYLWVLGQIVDFNNSEGDLVGHVITFTDITQIKKAEAAQKQLTAAIDQAAEAIVITNLEGTITYVNPAFEQITGYLHEEAVGKNPKILKSGEQDKYFYEELWSTITSGEVWHGRFVNKRKDGQRYTQEATIGPVRDEDGNTISYVGVARDISDQLTIEAQLRQAQKLESIGELAAGIAHEINTPTQYVSTNAQFMEESYETLMGMLNKCRELVQAVKTGEASEALLKLAENAVDEKELDYLAEDIPNALKESAAGLTRITEIVQSVKQLAHPGEVHKGLHDVNEIITNAMTVSANEWKYVADIELDLEDEIPEVYCLKGEIGQVFLNLIVNGAHAIETKIGNKADYKGRITIRTYQDEDNVIITIADSGTGMPQDVIDRAFDPFFTTKEVGKGTGQGLAIAHNVIVNMHCGDILVETEEGAGSTFTVKLPTHEECAL